MRGLPEVSSTRKLQLALLKGLLPSSSSIHVGRGRWKHSEWKTKKAALSRGHFPNASGLLYPHRRRGPFLDGVWERGIQPRTGSRSDSTIRGRPGELRPTRLFDREVVRNFILHDSDVSGEGIRAEWAGGRQVPNRFLEWLGERAGRPVRRSYGLVIGGISI